VWHGTARSCTRLRWLALGRRVAARCRVGVAAQRTLQCCNITPYPPAQTTGISIHPEINDRRTLSSLHTASPSIRQISCSHASPVGGNGALIGRHGGTKPSGRGMVADAWRVKRRIGAAGHLEKQDVMA
jgi:hypothetical protein